jgi:para-nitrobenzyl esterase
VRVPLPTVVPGQSLVQEHAVEINPSDVAAFELPFVFDTLDAARDFVSDDAPVDLAQALHGAWVRFAATGDPNGGELTDWPTYNTDTRTVMDFGAIRQLLHNPNAAQRQLWDDVW